MKSRKKSPLYQLGNNNRLLATTRLLEKRSAKWNNLLNVRTGTKGGRDKSSLSSLPQSTFRLLKILPDDLSH